MKTPIYKYQRTNPIEFQFRHRVVDPVIGYKYTDTPVTLLQRFQQNPYIITPYEREVIWGFFQEYVARCEKHHFGSTDKKGMFQDQTTVRVMALWAMMLELKDARVETYPYAVKGVTKRAKACKLTAPCRHPNLVLTYYRMTFPNLELIIRSRILFGVDLTIHGLTWDVNSTTTNRWSKIAAEFRKGRNKSLPLDVYNVLARKSWTKTSQRIWLRACCQYYLWLRYQCRTISIDIYRGDDMNGNVDLLSMREGENVFS